MGVVVTRWLLSGACAVLLASFLAAADDVTRLHNGYETVYTDRYNRGIVRGSSIIVYPHVSKMMEIDSYVVGIRQLSEYPLLQQYADFNSGFGYFMHDTQTGEVTIGLTAEELMSECAVLRISENACRDVVNSD
jgi:hypothetical protein